MCAPLPGFSGLTHQVGSLRASSVTGAEGHQPHVGLCARAAGGPALLTVLPRGGGGGHKSPYARVLEPVCSVCHLAVHPAP